METAIQILLTAVITCVVQHIFLDIRERRQRRSQSRDNKQRRR